MKKYFFLSLIAAFTMIFSANAQENTYNMVIKMANGNTITIGPNEIDNISFNDGAIVVSGAKIEELVNDVQAAKQKMDDLEALVSDNQKKVQGDVQIINPETGEPYTLWGVHPETGERGYFIPLTLSKMKEVYEKVIDLQAQIAYLQEKIMILETEISMLK